MLMADDGFHLAGFEHIPDLHAFRAGQRHRLLHGDEPRTAFDSGAYHLNPQIGHGAEAENIWPKRIGELAGIRGFRRRPQAGGGGIHPGLVDVADAHYFEMAVSLKRGSVVHSALAQADYHHTVWLLDGRVHATPFWRSHSRTFSMTQSTSSAVSSGNIGSDMQHAALRSELGMADGICAGLPHGYPSCWWMAMG